MAKKKNIKNAVKPSHDPRPMSSVKMDILQFNHHFCCFRLCFSLSLDPSPRSMAGKRPRL